MSVTTDYPAETADKPNRYIPKTITMSVTIRGKTETKTFRNSKFAAEPDWVTNNSLKCGDVEEEPIES